MTREEGMRILSLAPSNTEILYALGVGDDIVGVTAFCDEPYAAQSKPKVGGWTEVYPDLLERFAPDMIVTSMYVPPQLRTLKEQRPELFCHVEPHTLDDVYTSITTIGERVGRTKQAAELMRRMRSEFDALRLQTAGRSRINFSPSRREGEREGEAATHLIRIYIEEWSSPPMASGNWVPEVAAAVGLEQVVVKPGEWSREFRFEDLKSADPACIVLSICGQRDRVPTQQVANRLGWGELHAVREDRIAVIDDSLLNRPGPRLPDGARALAAVVTRTLIGTTVPSRP